MTLPTLCIGDVYKLHLTGSIKIYGDAYTTGQQMVFSIPDVMGNTTFDMLSTIDEVDFEIDISIHVRKANKFLTEFYTFLKFSIFSDILQCKTSIQTLTMEELPNIINLDVKIGYTAISRIASDYFICKSMILTKL